MQLELFIFAVIYYVTQTQRSCIIHLNLLDLSLKSRFACTISLHPFQVELRSRRCDVQRIFNIYFSKPVLSSTDRTYGNCFIVHSNRTNRCDSRMHLKRWNCQIATHSRACNTWKNLPTIYFNQRFPTIWMGGAGGRRGRRFYLLSTAQKHLTPSNSKRLIFFSSGGYFRQISRLPMQLGFHERYFHFPFSWYDGYWDASGRIKLARCCAATRIFTMESETHPFACLWIFFIVV